MFNSRLTFKEAIESPRPQSDEPTSAQSCATGVLFTTGQLGRINNSMKRFGRNCRRNSGSQSVQRSAPGAVGIAKRAP